MGVERGWGCRAGGGGCPPLVLQDSRWLKGHGFSASSSSLRRRKERGEKIREKKKNACSWVLYRSVCKYGRVPDCPPHFSCKRSTPPTRKLFVIKATEPGQVWNVCDGGCGLCCCCCLLHNSSRPTKTSHPCKRPHQRTLVVTNYFT